MPTIRMKAYVQYSFTFNGIDGAFFQHFQFTHIQNEILKSKECLWQRKKNSVDNPIYRVINIL